METLRERKQLQTRQRISDRATRLFEQRGFEKVTLADVAAASDVSIKTVTNYFGAKEDLFFDAEPAIIEALVAALAARGSRSATAALRPLLLEGPILSGSCPWRSVTKPMWRSMRRWAECERDSPTLTARRALIIDSWMEPLAEASGSQAWGALAVGVILLRHRIVQDGLVAGEESTRVQRRVARTVGGALAALERAFPPG